MPTTGTPPHQISPRLIFVFSVFTSLTLSWFYISKSHVLTPDSLLYIFTAQTFLNEGLKAAIDVYSWPFLSILIAVIHTLSGLSLEASGYILSALMYAGLTYTFVLLTRDLGGTTRTQLLALLVISIFPTLNDTRDFITRDSGFWFFILLSLLQLLRFAQHQQIKHALSWFVLTLIAIAFRTEAAFFAVLTPFALLSNNQISLKQRLKSTLILYAFCVGAGILALAAILTTPQLSEKLRLISELAALSDFFQSMANGFRQITESFSGLVGKTASSDASKVIGTGLVGLTIYTFLHALTLPFLILLCWRYKQAIFSNPKYKYYLIAFLLIIFSYLLLLSFKKFFVSDRFCIMATLIVMLALPFRIENIWLSPPGKLKWRRMAIIFLLLIPVLDSLITSGSSKEYIANAANWVKENKTPEQALRTNSRQVAVLGGKCWHQCIIDGQDTLILESLAQQPDLLAIRIKRKEASQVSELNHLLTSEEWRLLKTFANKNDDKVLIFSSHKNNTTAKN